MLTRRTLIKAAAAVSAVFTLPACKKAEAADFRPPDPVDLDVDVYWRHVCRLAEKYRGRIEALMRRWDSHLDGVGVFKRCGGLDLSWEIYVDVDDVQHFVDFEIVASADLDGTLEGINFRSRVMKDGGQVLGELFPYNFTDRCWADVDDAAELEDRLRMFEEVDPEDIGKMILKG